MNRAIKIETFVMIEIPSTKEKAISVSISAMDIATFE